MRYERPSSYHRPQAAPSHDLLIMIYLLDEIEKRLGKEEVLKLMAKSPLHLPNDPQQKLAELNELLFILWLLDSKKTEYVQLKQEEMRWILLVALGEETKKFFEEKNWLDWLKQWQEYLHGKKIWENLSITDQEALKNKYLLFFKTIVNAINDKISHWLKIKDSLILWMINEKKIIDIEQKEISKNIRNILESLAIMPLVQEEKKKFIINEINKSLQSETPNHCALIDRIFPVCQELFAYVDDPLNEYNKDEQRKIEQGRKMLSDKSALGSRENNINKVSQMVMQVDAEITLLEKHKNRLSREEKQPTFDVESLNLATSAFLNPPSPGLISSLNDFTQSNHYSLDNNPSYSSDAQHELSSLKASQTSLLSEISAETKIAEERAVQKTQKYSNVAALDDLDLGDDDNDVHPHRP